ncbi:MULTISPECIES: complex I 24 kDa subunit family protein [Dehalococcoides]|jgi:NADH:ubiquinone oxidoreductase subunit E|uniref:NAD-reducing hydrogenase subunit HoxE n=2 Tax=Dehalococcoides mccartyi TaxID=61435 RepID=A0A142V8H0_9CHLR|nr:MULTISPECIES: NAD(P)H-dependent oxidoreductase subunit E [Dehalococcoides]AGG05800.1 [FeFe] hydrogenase small subunit [Dehalococcoides mccartyi DCMB5]AGG07214.1 [FeFe] hydrogenase small subunit [Dehalococcoides mccartyi BTF08]AII60365.1 iron hydrogenase [Dehalococcoides mccartyi CG5]AMU85939.1 [Fe] hydrogenase subunit [Dehalococcoides mccartyi]AOV98813.1 [Fe] hydrogenase, hymA subunit [Dehalococcoides mccartyi]
MESIWKEKVDGVITQSGSSRLSLLPCLEAVQEECGYIPHEAVNYLRECLSIPSIDIYGMITFYSLLSTNQKGKYVIRLCNSLPCYLNGTENILDTLVDNLGIEPGQTTLDRRFTLELVPCLGLCDQSPAMVINGVVYGKLTAQLVTEVLDELRTY